MKKSYFQSINKEVVDVKKYVLALSKDTVIEKDVSNLVLYSLDTSMIKRKIHKNKFVETTLFLLIKSNIETASTIEQLEEQLIYMNLLLEETNTIRKYKDNLQKHIVENSDFDTSIYCLIRHLVPFKEKKVKNIIKYLYSIQGSTKVKYHQESLKIYCIEHCYKEAMLHSQYVDTVENQLYIRQLELYNPILYYFISKKRKANTVLALQS